MNSHANAVDLIVTDDSAGWDIPSANGGTVHIPGPTQQEPTNLMVKGYSIAKLPVDLQEQLKNADIGTSELDIYSIPEKALISIGNELILALPCVNHERGEHLVAWSGLVPIRDISAFTAHVALYKVASDVSKFFVVYECDDEFYCLMGRPVVPEKKSIPIAVSNVLPPSGKMPTHWPVPGREYIFMLEANEDGDLELWISRKDHGGEGQFDDRGTDFEGEDEFGAFMEDIAGGEDNIDQICESTWSHPSVCVGGEPTPEMNHRLEQIAAFFRTLPFMHELEE